MEDEELQLSFVALVNPTKALVAITTMKQTFLKIFFLVLFLGIISVCFLGWHSYRPMHKIEDLLKKYGKEKMVKYSSQALPERISYFLTENQVLQEEIEKQSTHQREQFLRKLLSGRLEEKEVKSFSTPFIKEGAFIFVVDLKGLNKNCSLKTENEVVEKLMHFNEENYLGFGTELLFSQILAVMVIFEGTTQEKIMAEINQQLKIALKIILPIGVGRVTKDLTKVNRSYIESLAALELCYSEREMVYYQELILTSSKGVISYPEEKQLMLIKSLHQGDEGIAKETLNWLLHYGIEGENSREGKKMYGYYLLNTMAKVGGEICGPEIPQEIEHLAGFRHLSELEAPLKIFIEKICLQSQVPTHEGESQLKQNIFAFIKDNYTSTQFSLEALAEEFHLSISYLSRFIKKESGDTFSKYIQNLRMEKIKRDLIETDKAIKEIIQECGYCDVSNYTRKFRNLVGVTPGQYRSLNRQEKEHPA